MKSQKDPLSQREIIEFAAERHGGCRLDFEHENLQLTLDAAYELEYRLAEFLTAAERSATDPFKETDRSSQIGQCL